MAVNPYFKDHRGEQKLLDDLTIETIKAMGRDLIYLPREYLKIDPVFGEDPKSYFRDGFILEMYVRETLKFGGNKDIMTKFGVTVTDRLTIDLSITRFVQEVTTKNPEIKKPREGDLIYYPLSKSIFEINFVEDEEPFYQFGSLTTYTLQCELFTYSYEDIDTGFTEIDEVQSKRSDAAINLGITGSSYTPTVEFIGGETIYQQDASATLIEASSGSTGIPTSLYITNVSGEFVSGITVYGAESGAQYMIDDVETTNVIIPKDPKSDIAIFNNDGIKKQSYTIEFSSDNPFSEN